MIILFSSFLIFIFGLGVGSFLNSVIYRLEKGESFLKGRSFCPNCKHILSWRDLIPVLSFLFLRGKCRYCSQRISWQYPLVELATGFLFLLTIFFVFPSFFQDPFVLVKNSTLLLISIYYLAIISFLIIIFVYDLKHFIIPDKIIYPAIALTFIYQISPISPMGPMRLMGPIGPIAQILNFLLAASGAAAFFLLFFLLSQGKWLGLGDVKLAFLMGLILGWPKILIALFLGFFFGAIIGIALIISGRKTLKSPVPFGPFLVTGTILALFFAKNLINWYLNFFYSV